MEANSVESQCWPVWFCCSDGITVVMWHWESLHHHWWLLHVWIFVAVTVDIALWSEKPQWSWKPSHFVIPTLEWNIFFWKSPRCYCLMISPHNNMVSPSQTNPAVFICWMTIYTTISAGWHQVSLRALWFRRNVSPSLIKHPSDWGEPHLKNWVLLTRRRNSPVACCITIAFGWFCLVAIVYIF